MSPGRFVPRRTPPALLSKSLSCARELAVSFAPPRLRVSVLGFLSLEDIFREPSCDAEFDGLSELVVDVLDVPLDVPLSVLGVALCEKVAGDRRGALNEACDGIYGRSADALRWDPGAVEKRSLETCSLYMEYRAIDALLLRRAAASCLSLIEVRPLPRCAYSW